MTPDIRPVQENDLPQLHHMICALAAHHGDVPDINPSHLARDVLGPAPWFHVLVAAGAPSCLHGYTPLLPRGQLQMGTRSMDMHHLFVRPAHRGTGLGCALTRAAIAHCKALGCQAITVGTHPDHANAGAFYERRGFIRYDASNPRFMMTLDQPPT
ncbi:MAG: GNAT family N-acetyltransferase [Pseudomonadota bacterium]